MINPAVAVTIPIQSTAPLSVVRPNTTLAPMIPAPAATRVSPRLFSSLDAIGISFRKHSNVMLNDGHPGHLRAMVPLRTGRLAARQCSWMYMDRHADTRATGRRRSLRPMRPDELERRLLERLDALGPAPRAELLHDLMLPDFRPSRPDRRVLGLPAEPVLRRVADRLRGGSDAASGASWHAAGSGLSPLSTASWRCSVARKCLPRKTSGSACVH